MANPFLTNDGRDVETAILLDKANVVDIGKAVAYADSKGRMFLNTDENLKKLLPAYDDILMKKWLLWHEHMHLTFRHHERFFKYRDTMLADIATTAEKFNVSMQEVNIIMDILVHDWMCEKFPELIETAVANLAQMRNRNSLGYTFKTHTLEEMLDEYRHRETADDSSSDKGGDPTEGDDGEPTSETTDDDGKSTPSKRKKDTPTEDDDKSSSPAHSGGEDPAEDKKSPIKGKTPTKDKDDDTTDKHPSDKDSEQPADEHDKTDWSKLKDIDDEEFIDEDKGDRYIEKAERLKRKKIRLGTITQKLNALATTTKIRTYRTPSLLDMGDGCIFKGKLPGKTALYLVFDASGSMGCELAMFKDIINRSVPQALECPCEWFSGWKHSEKDVSKDYKKHDYKHNGRTYWDYYKGRFKDIMDVEANGGYNDDGDRTLELCIEAEQKGYSPIGVTDGGWEDDDDGYFIRNKELRDKIKTLKRTVIVTQSSEFIEELKKLNPTLQTIYVGD